jgi:peptide-methionine (S)-S-oxide reductase
VVEVRYDPDKVSYAKLLEVFWHNIDPTVSDRQFCDVGSQYRTAIFFHDQAQQQAAQASKAALEQEPRFKNTIKTEINAAAEFWPAEDKHQDYYRRSPGHYKFYRFGCGRDQRLRELWGERAGH